MQLPFKPTGYYLHTEDGRYCTTGWLISELFKIKGVCAYLTNQMSPTWTFCKLSGATFPLGFDKKLAEIFSKNDQRKFEEAFKMLPEFLKAYETYFRTICPETYDPTLQKIEAIIEEWEVASVITWKEPACPIA